jgi:hypothetical protein
LRARLGSEKSGVQIPVKTTHFFSNCLSQINIGLNISVAISVIANLLQVKRYSQFTTIKRLESIGGTIQKQIVL